MDYGPGMTGELSDPTSSLVRRWFADTFNDPDAWVDGRVASKLAPGFVRIDRRPMVAQPVSDADAFIDSILDFRRLTGGPPTFAMHEVVGVRGKRLIAHRLIAHLGLDDELRLIMLAQIDALLERIELLVQFDWEDLNDALAELDRLHAELGEE